MKCKILPPNISIGKVKGCMYMLFDRLHVNVKFEFILMRIFFYSLLLLLNSIFTKVIIGGV